jgi:hypothetical protein
MLCSLFATGVVDTGGKFAAGIVDTGGKFATGINNTSETGGKICHRCRWYRWQFATGVADTGGNLPPVSLTPVANLPPVSLMPVVHLDLRISKFETVLMGFYGAGGKLIEEKKPEAKNLVTLAL